MKFSIIFLHLIFFWMRHVSQQYTSSIQTFYSLNVVWETKFFPKNHIFTFFDVKILQSFEKKLRKLYLNKIIRSKNTMFLMCSACGCLWSTKNCKFIYLRKHFAKIPNIEIHISNFLWNRKLWDFVQLFSVKLFSNMFFG